MRAILARPRPLTEAQFQRQVLDLARVLGWSTVEGPDGALEGLTYHPQLAKWSERGWPDLALLRRRDGRIVFAELKSEHGQPTPRQLQVLDLLRACGAEAYLWRPSDLEHVAEVLR